MSLIDTIYTYKFIKMLATPWVEQPAYKLGIIDDKGKVLRKANELKTDAEKKAYTPFHRLGWNLKRIVQKMPGGGSKFANYASALFLLRENRYRTGLTSTDLSMIENTLNEGLPPHLAKHFKGQDVVIDRTPSFKNDQTMNVTKADYQKAKTLLTNLSIRYSTNGVSKIVTFRFSDPKAFQKAKSEFKKHNIKVTVMNEEPTNVIGDAGENDNIDTFDPILKAMQRRKKKKKGCAMKDDENSKEDMKEDHVEDIPKEPPPIQAREDDEDELEADKKETPARTNELKDAGGKFQDRTSKTVNAFKFQNSLGQKMPTHGDWTFRYMGKNRQEDMKILKIATMAGMNLKLMKAGYNARGSVDQHQHLIDALQKAGIHGRMAYGHQKNEEYDALREEMNMEHETDFDFIKEAMKRRKKRDAHGRVKKFYKRTSDCPPGKIKNRKGGCDKIGGNRSMQQIRKTIKVGQRKRKKTLKKKSGSFWKMADMRRKKTKRA